MYVGFCKDYPMHENVVQGYDWKEYQSLLDNFSDHYKYSKKDKVFFHDPIIIAGKVSCKFSHHFTFRYNIFGSSYGLWINDEFVPTNWRYILEKYRPEYYASSTNNSPNVYDFKTAKLLLCIFFSWQKIIEKELRLLADGYYADKYSTES